MTPGISPWSVPLLDARQFILAGNEHNEADSRPVTGIIGSHRSRCLGQVCCRLETERCGSEVSGASAVCAEMATCCLDVCYLPHLLVSASV